TYASRKLADDVPVEVKKARLQAVEAVHKASSERINRAILGQTVEVLVEQIEDGRASGRTRRGQIVHFGYAGERGDLVDVTVSQVTPWSAQGHVADELTLSVV
ncbi:MAG: TRAM domain-containing protein, partial [Dehalococcoidia bacterium]|nr:TRAM domain-containing protein [Dehalococcoidia bacterium]